MSTRFEVEHHTWYTYTGPVGLDPHVLRLRPRSDPAQRVLAYALDVVPAPAGLSGFLDRDGNDATHAWFEGTTQRLDIRSSVVAEATRANAYDFVVHPPDQARLPLRYPEGLAPVLAPYREASGSREVAGWAEETAAKTDHDTVEFLAALARRMHAEFRGEVRREGDPLPPERVLAARAGPCRDLTLLFMDACRAMGLAARFVSGYAEGAPGPTGRELHAWPEVYLAGAGWRGWDPSLGLAVADRHIAVAAGRTPPDAAPVGGSFRSAPGVRGTLHHAIAMRVGPAAAGDP